MGQKCSLSKPMLDVAFVAAILPLTVSIYSKLLTAVRADKIVVGFPVNHVHIIVPPVIPAFIAAEQLLLTLRFLLDFRTTILAIHILVFCVRKLRHCLAFTP